MTVISAPRAALAALPLALLPACTEARAPTRTDVIARAAPVRPAADAEAEAEAAIRARLDRWFAAWSPGDAPFDWEAFRPLFAEGEILVVDDFGGGITVLRSFDEYVATWAPALAGYERWSITPTEEIDLRVGETLAVASFVFQGEGVTTAGETVRPRQRGTLVFEEGEGGDWRIVQEELRTLPEEGGAAAGDTEAAVRDTILAWGEAWMVRDDAEAFDLAPVFDRFYADDVLAFDTSDDAGRTVIRGRGEFLEVWQPFVRSWDHWEFNVLPGTIDVRPLGPDAAVATLYVDNYGRRADGTEFEGPAQGTLLLRRDGEDWRIAHEHISLPRRDPQEDGR